MFIDEVVCKILQTFRKFTQMLNLIMEIHFPFNSGQGRPETVVIQRFADNIKESEFLGIFEFSDILYCGLLSLCRIYQDEG